VLIPLLLLKETPTRCGLLSLVDRVLFGVEYPYQTQALNLVPKSSYKLLVVGFHLMIIVLKTALFRFQRTIGKYV
jgi:hypothetical protein